jgi:hypothetical protein
MIVLGIFWIVRLWEASIYVCKEQHFRIQIRKAGGKATGKATPFYM